MWLLQFGRNFCVLTSRSFCINCCGGVVSPAARIKIRRRVFQPSLSTPYMSPTVGVWILQIYSWLALPFASLFSCSFAWCSRLISCKFSPGQEAVFLNHYHWRTLALKSSVEYGLRTTLYYSVLQSATPVLLCTTKSTPVLLRTTKYYSVLQSATPVLQSTIKYYSVLQSAAQTSATQTCNTQKENADQRNPEMQNTKRKRRPAQPWIAKRQWEYGGQRNPELQSAIGIRRPEQPWDAKHHKNTQTSATLNCKTLIIRRPAQPWDAKRKQMTQTIAATLNCKTQKEYADQRSCEIQSTM